MASQRKSGKINFFSVFAENTYFPLINGYPIRGWKPLVASDVSNTILQISITFCQVNLEQIS